MNEPMWAGDDPDQPRCQCEIPDPWYSRVTPMGDYCARCGSYVDQAAYERMYKYYREHGEDYEFSDEG